MTRILYKPFGQRSRRIVTVETESERMHETLANIIKQSPLAALVGVFDLEANYYKEVTV